jgi:hypothetical protein
MNINKLGRSILLTVFSIAAFGIAACTTPEVKSPATPSPSPVAPASPAASPAASVNPTSKVDSLVGRWPGVEGTYLNIVKKGDKYSIEIANLDGAKTFEGTAKGDSIEFTRDGKTETVKAASGVETGMKGLEKETNCVVVTKGKEGFCKK